MSKRPSSSSSLNGDDESPEKKHKTSLQDALPKKDLRQLLDQFMTSVVAASTPTDPYPNAIKTNAMIYSIAQLLQYYNDQMIKYRDTLHGLDASVRRGHAVGANGESLQHVVDQARILIENLSKSLWLSNNDATPPATATTEAVDDFNVIHHYNQLCDFWQRIDQQQPKGGGGGEEFVSFDQAKTTLASIYLFIARIHKTLSELIIQLLSLHADVDFSFEILLGKLRQYVLSEVQDRQVDLAFMGNYLSSGSCPPLSSVCSTPSDQSVSMSGVIVNLLLKIDHTYSEEVTPAESLITEALRVAATPTDDPLYAILGQLRIESDKLIKEVRFFPKGKLMRLI